MAEFTRLYGNACAVNTNYTIAAHAVLVRVRKYGGTAVDLRNETIIDGTVEQIVKEVNPLMFYVEDNTSGNIHMVVDKTLTADDLQNRIRLIGANAYSTTAGIYANTNVGPNHIDVSNTYVYEATRFTVIG
jgi:hypothetical protein